MSDKDKKYWLSPEQKNDTSEYRDELLKRFKNRDYKDGPDFTRRGFLGIMAASAALAGLAGCRRPVEKIVPYVKQAEEIVPGVPLYYATAMPTGTSSRGIVVETHEGRPTKIEGNTAHPASLGSSDSMTQAEILNLYDPDRSQKIYQKGIEKSYDDFIAFWRELYDKYAANKGQGLAVITGESSSPTLAGLKKDFDRLFPRADWANYEPISDEVSATAIKNVTGQALRPSYNYDKAKVIVSIDADFLQGESENVLSARKFSDGRFIDNPDGSLNRLYMIESQFSVTGSMADHRLPMRSGDVGYFAMAIAKALEAKGIDLKGIASGSLVKFDNKWIPAIVDDLMANRGASIVVAGRNQPQWVHELALAINSALDNFGKTIEFFEYTDAQLSSTKNLKSLVDKINAGNIETLFVLGGSPAYNFPADLKFDKLFKKIAHTIHLSDYYDDSSAKSEWHLNRSHLLENWGDVRAFDGSASIIQPMISPLYDGHSEIEIMSLITTGLSVGGFDLVRKSWKKIVSGNFEKGWRRALHDGIYSDSKAKTVNPRIKYSAMSGFPMVTSSVLLDDRLEAVFYPSLLYDGRYANNGWMQELPDPVSKLTWDNAAIMNAKTAKRFNLASADIIRLGVGNENVRIPVWIVPGTADNTISLALGYGRQNIGRVADGVGTDLYPIRNTNNLYIVDNIKLEKTGEVQEMANTQDHNSMEGRPIFREGSLAEYKKHPEFAREMVEHPPLKSLFDDHDYSKGYQWGMTIDLNSCIGCGACTTACQSENNIPVVGKKQVGNGREMHWMRVDRYFVGDEDNPEMVHMPVTCQHCENAPCESVCPVAATTHDKEGVNNMTYNRCIGTRYCSNNCPYKVRKFNFFNYIGSIPETIKMAQNPDVTVRFRGVMEKCTFCIQRINRSKINAKNNGDTVKDGEVVSACQQACPTKAISFGNINDPDAEVTKLRKMDRSYELLGELNVRPRNSYLARIRNRHPDLDKT